MQKRQTKTRVSKPKMDTKKVIEKESSKDLQVKEIIKEDAKVLEALAKDEPPKKITLADFTEAVEEMATMVMEVEGISIYKKRQFQKSVRRLKLRLNR